MAYQFATYEKKGRIAVVTVNRPERMNALHPPANFELHEIWNDFERDPDVWVGILTGAGDKAFSAGNDLRYTASTAATWCASADSGFGGLASRTTCWKPILAAVNGYALGRRVRDGPRLRHHHRRRPRPARPARAARRPDGWRRRRPSAAAR